MLLKNLRDTGEVENIDTNVEVASEDNAVNEFQRVIEGLPINVMLCDPETLDIIYANNTSIETLRTLEEYLPIKADDRRIASFSGICTICVTQGS